jgi:hypothetical protein
VLHAAKTTSKLGKCGKSQFFYEGPKKTHPNVENHVLHAEKPLLKAENPRFFICLSTTTYFQKKKK